MAAFLILLLIVALVVERWSMKNALRGVKYDMRMSKSLVEPGEGFEMITTLRTTERRFVPFLRLSEDVPQELQINARRRANGFDESRARINSTTYLMPLQKMTRRLFVSLPERGRYVFRGATLFGGDFLGLSEQIKYAPLLREVVVMPRVLTAPDVMDTLGGFLGAISVNRYILEDPVLTLGFRDYTGREPMKMISWPVTARTGRMMVKNFDHTLELTVTVVLNADTASEGSEGRELLERCFSLTRDICQTLEEKHIKYAFCTNCVAAGMVGPWRNVGEGLGAGHLSNLLEGLGRATYTRHAGAQALLEDARQRAEAGRAHVIVTPMRADIDAASLERLRARTGAEALLICAEEVTVA